ncbi:hypothetical protein CY34DRAFT_810817 [Suillus luteus UH-Slu-Lm8-n1]|uniref:Uncharacterized protein n=1 Tax=Suillus luteus UH-Slu-Lm8-n1 TaxID=930992 RepID=A0A0D0AFS0_9AGAM|nr:hypothetical protein CY34DRAFT_810817 [Suillus luteus UH-Slu-Lm8-n1]
MRFSSVFALVVAALASSISATPIDAGVQHCPAFCAHSRQCATGTKGRLYMPSESESSAITSVKLVHGTDL